MATPRPALDRVIRDRIRAPAFEGAPLVAVVSRCAWTLHNFRLPLLRALSEAGTRPVALGHPLRGFEHRLAEHGVQFEPIPVSLVGFDPVGDLRLFARLVKCFRRLKPSIVHTFTVRPAIFATLAARVTGVPVRIVTITGLGHAFTTGGRMVRVISEWLYRLALAQADIVFFQNADDRALFLDRRLVARERTRLIAGSGVDLDHFTVRPRLESVGIPCTFVMIARLLREKGVLEYAGAIKIVRQSFPAARFLLVGGTDSHNPSSLSEAEVAEMRRQDLVEWVGEVDDVRPLIEGSDVVVLPSYREGVPRSLLEGAAMGRALIATDVPGCREVVEEGVTGLLVPPRDAEALAVAMCRLIENPMLRSRLAAAARRRVEESFDQRIVIDTTLRAYRDLLRTKQAAVSAS